MATGGLTAAELASDVAAACARFGIKTEFHGSRERRLLQAMLKINRNGRPATAKELAIAAEINTGGGGQVSLSLRRAEELGYFVKPKAGSYVITEAGERSLG